jgi:hypothetical protein
MPYSGGERLPAETASKLGHLEVLQSPLVNRLVSQFQRPVGDIDTNCGTPWQPIDASGISPLSIIFAADGSFQIVRTQTQPLREIAFIKTALLRLDQERLRTIDREEPHPIALRRLMTDAAIYHATAFPLRNIRIDGQSNYDAVRGIVNESMRDTSLDGEPHVTLKWLAYQQWLDSPQESPSFRCPCCENERSGHPPNADSSRCPSCGANNYLSDMLGFHLDMGEDVASQTVASAYMSVHETLLIFTAIRYFWQHRRRVLPDCLFIKDGPLALNSQYSKLVPNIRGFLCHARDSGFTVHLMGQEKTGAFADHLALVARTAPERSVAVLSDSYIREQIQGNSQTQHPYGERTNYGGKMFVKLGNGQAMVLGMATGEHKSCSTLADFIGAERILATLPELVSYRHEGALIPIELANGIASLSTYPSAQVLRLFAGLA